MTAIANRHWGVSVGMALAVHAAMIAMLPPMKFKPSPLPTSPSVIVELAPPRIGSPKAGGGGGDVIATPAVRKVVPKPETKPMPAVARPVIRQAAISPPLPPSASRTETRAALTDEPSTAMARPSQGGAADSTADAGSGIGNGPGPASGDGIATGQGAHGGGVFKVDAAVLSHKGSAAYVQTLSSWLEQYRQYPRRARLTNTEGTVLLRFRIDRQGNLLAWNVVRSSGSAMLDKAVEDMITAAHPLPPVPSDFAGAGGAQSLEFVLPIEFRLLS